MRADPYPHMVICYKCWTHVHAVWSRKLGPVHEYHSKDGKICPGYGMLAFPDIPLKRWLPKMDFGNWECWVDVGVGVGNIKAVKAA